jgi:archaellum component FlaD/FlaE
LDGLKVVGKIDLPEPKIKEEAEPAAEISESNDADTPVEEIKEKPVRRKIVHRNNNRRPQKRVLTLEEKREKEERAKKIRNKRLKEDEKQMKTAHYESKMRERKNTSPPKNSKRKNIKIQQTQEEPMSILPPPTSIIGKFLRWLNT